MSKHTLQHLDSALVSNVHPTLRRIYVFDEIGSSAAQLLRVSLDVLSTASTAHIDVTMSSEGGCVYAGLSMYDALKTCRAPITMTTTGTCMSMAVAVLQGATVRRATKLTTFMVHDGVTAADGHSRNVEAWGIESRRLRNLYYEILASRSVHNVAWWERNCMVDRIFTADEALAWGLIDEVVE